MRSLRIASGQAAQIDVLDVRTDYEWAPAVGVRGHLPPSGIYLHHTADVRSAPDIHGQMRVMRQAADSDPFGLPYNFLVWPGDRVRVYYLNDVDRCWPHTYGHNCDVAIAAWGNYETDVPGDEIAATMLQLVNALRSMWLTSIPTYFHRAVYATVCPGDNLVAQLLAAGLGAGQ